MGLRCFVIFGISHQNGNLPCNFLQVEVVNWNSLAIVIISVLLRSWIDWLALCVAFRFGFGK